VDYWYWVRFLAAQFTIGALAWAVLRMWRVL